MKKSKLKIGLVTSFICGMALTACDVTADKDYVVKFKDFSGSELGLLTENMYEDYLDTDAGLTKYYEKVRDLLILSTFEKVTATGEDCLKVKTPYATLNAQAANKVEEQKETARKNAKNNDTSYSDELDAIYDSHGVEDEDGLRQKFLLDLEKEQLEDAILDNTKQLEELKAGWIASAKPYHIKHMLVKVESGASDFVRASITQAEAEKLSKIVTLLADGNKFDDLAANDLLNDDSSDKLGDVGIVNNNATTKSLKMVSEFQLGIYTADVKINGVNAEKIGLDSKIKLGLDNEPSTVRDNLDVDRVPYSAFVKLADVAKYPEATENEKVVGLSSVVYPRNVLWNKYFNNHNVFVITGDAPSTDLTKSGFRTIGSENLLCAEDGKVIFGVRSEYGVHFIKIQKSAFEADISDYYPISLTDNVEGTYVDCLDDTKDTKESRLSEIKSAIKSFDSSVDYKLYEKLVSFATDHNIINANDEATSELLGKINKHIADLKANDAYKQEEGIKTVWENYLRLIELQDQTKAAKWDESYFYTTYVEGKPQVTYMDYTYKSETNDKRRSALLPEAVADAYKALCLADGTSKATLLKDFLEGGEYYYAK